MGESSSTARELVPIDEVARRFGIRASTLRYYEERGLLRPVSRHAGRRWYGQVELRRLAVIRYWQTSASMSLEDIGHILAGPGAGNPDDLDGGNDDAGNRDAGNEWHGLLDRQLRSLREKVERMEAAVAFLEHVASYHSDAAPDGCPHYEALIWGREPPSAGERTR